MPLLLHLRRDFAPYALNSQSLYERVNAIPLLQWKQLRLLATQPSVDCLRFMVMAIVARLFYVPIIVLDDCNNAAFARSNCASTRTTRIGDASASRGRVLRVISTDEGFWRAAGEHPVR
jgi:hypothetical protein